MPSSFPNRAESARTIRAAKSVILRNWESRVRAEISAAQHHDHPTLLDSMPEFMDELARTLETVHAPTDAQCEVNAEIAVEHGEERANLGNYSLSQMIYEYQLLREVLFEELETAISLTLDTRSVLNSFLDRGIRKAAVRFTNLALRRLEDERELRERFVATLSHDLRTPLTVTRMTAQMMGLKAHTSEQAKRLSDRIVTNVDRADRMIRDLLDANRIQVGQPLPITPVDCQLDEIVEGVAAEFRDVAHAEIQVEGTQGPNPHLSGRWDRDSLRRVIENLVGNAIKYGQKDGPIRIRVATNPEFVEVEVHNDGDPISPEDLLGLFSAYRRTDSARTSGQKGWGLGLTLVKGIAEAHQGSVRVTSTAQEGTTFTVRLPR